MAAAARADDRRDGVDRAAPGPGAPRQPASGLQAGEDREIRASSRESGAG
mgnify:CR=1 FL=1